MASAINRSQSYYYLPETEKAPAAGRASAPAEDLQFEMDLEETEEEDLAGDQSLQQFKKALADSPKESAEDSPDPAKPAPQSRFRPLKDPELLLLPPSVPLINFPVISPLSMDRSPSPDKLSAGTIFKMMKSNSLSHISPKNVDSAASPTADISPVVSPALAAVPSAPLISPAAASPAPLPPANSEKPKKE